MNIKDYETRISGRTRRHGMTDSLVFALYCLWLQPSDFEQGQAQVSNGVQDAMQGGLIDNLAQEQGLARLLPCEGESPEANCPLLPEAALNTNTVPGGCRQHRSDPFQMRQQCVFPVKSVAKEKKFCLHPQGEFSGECVTELAGEDVHALMGRVT